jgi:hypothetical protein
MSELFLEALGECLADNYIKESVNNSAEIAQFGPLVSPLIKKIYPDSLVEQIASVQPLKSPVGRIAYLNSIYTGDKSNIENSIHWTNSCIITVDSSAASGFTDNGITTYVTSAGISFNVYYKEITQEYVATYATTGAASGSRLTSDTVDKYCHMLCKVLTGFPTSGEFLATAATSGSSTIYRGIAPLILTGDAISGVPVLYSTTNRNTIRKVFKDYSITLENNSNLLEINFEIATNVIETKSRKIRTRFNAETVQDYKNLYKEKAEELVAEAIANEIRQEIDREIIAYLKQVATPMANDINIPLSISNEKSGGLLDITYDAFASIFIAIEEIVKATKRNRTMFILADSATCGFLSLNPLHTEADPKESNPYYVGKVGTYPLYCDPYSTENYVIVGYKFNAPEKHDAGLYFAPYVTTMHEVPDANNMFIQNYITMNRYGYCLHPQDNGIGNADSDFFRFFSVNFFNPNTTIQNLTQQIRNFYS